MSSTPNTPKVDEEGFMPMVSRSQRRKLASQSKPPVAFAVSKYSPTPREQSVEMSSPIAAPKPPAPVQPVHQTCILASGFKDLSRHDREILLKNGPKVEVWHNGAKIFNISKRLIMAVSALAHRHFTADQTQPIIHLPDRLGKEAVVCVLGYFTNVCRVEYYKLGNPADCNMAGAIYQVARHLETGGSEAPVLGFLKHQIYNDKLGYTEYHNLLNRCDGTHDPLFELIAKSFARLRYLRKATDPATFAKFVAVHPQLATAMDSIDAEYSQKRQQVRSERAAQSAAQKAIEDAVFVTPSVYYANKA